MTAFLLTEPATPDIYTLSLHDALPISQLEYFPESLHRCPSSPSSELFRAPAAAATDRAAWNAHSRRSEEHTSELQSRRDLVCRLLLEKKKKSINTDCVILL